MIELQVVDDNKPADSFYQAQIISKLISSLFLTSIPDAAQIKSIDSFNSKALLLRDLSSIRDDTHVNSS